MSETSQSVVTKPDMRGAFDELVHAAKDQRHSNEVIGILFRTQLSSGIIDAVTKVDTLSEDARECLLDVVSHHHDFRTACIEVKAANETTRSDMLYWQKQIDVLDRMAVQAERALCASQKVPTPCK